MELSKPSKLLIRMIGVAALLIILIGIFYYRSFAALPFSFGVLILSGLNILKVHMLESTVQRVADMSTGEEELGKNVIRIRYLLRYFLTGIVLVAIGLIQNYTTEPPLHSGRTVYINIWAVLFPNGPESLLSAPLISIWGAVAGLFTLQIAVIIVRSFKLEKDGVNFIKYEDDTETVEDADSDDDNTGFDDSNDEKEDENNVENDVDY